MIAGERRAVVATLSFPGAEAALREALSSAGCALIGAVRDGREALRLIRDLSPELLLSDAILPGLDGPALAERIARSGLNVYPQVLLMRAPGGPEVRAAAWPVCGVVEKPVAGEAIRAALEDRDDWCCRLPERKAERLRALMDALGVPEHPGRECLAAAVALVYADRRRLGGLRSNVYPAAARRCRCRGEQAERAIRYVIDAAWRSGAINEQHRLFGDTIDARRGKPTCGEMIAQLADILRWEGA